MLSLLFLIASLAASVSQAENSKTIEILDERAYAYLSDNTQLTQHASGFKWSEGPLWIEQGKYWIFSDIPNNRVMKFSEASGLETYIEPAGATGLHPTDSNGGSNGLLLNNKGQLVLTQHGDRRVAIMDAPLSKPEPKFTTMASHYKGKRFNSPNDGVFHSNGDLFITDPPYGLNGGAKSQYRELDYTGIFAISPNGEVTLVDKSVDYPNGIGFSPDETKMYIASSYSPKPAWYMFDINEKGKVSNKRTMFDATNFKKENKLSGLPDGMAVHSTGAVFATGPGGVWLFSEEGDLLARIYTGKATANCALSSDEKTLFLTAHDVVMSLPIK